MLRQQRTSDSGGSAGVAVVEQQLDSSPTDLQSLVREVLSGERQPPDGPTVGEGLASPEREGFTEGVGIRRLGRQRREPVQVDPVPVEDEFVAVGMRREDLVAEHGAGPRRDRAQRIDGSLGEPIERPERVDQGGETDDAAGAQGQQRDQGPGLDPFDRNRCTADEKS
ncbi:MAG: hypothetical protein R2705_00435 [Ilumatobacteraceae bacterium]